MHKIKEKLMDELYEIEEKMKKSSGGKVSAGDLEYIHKLTDSIKNIDKIEMLEDGGGYSEESNWMADGRMYGTSYDNDYSYARGRRGNVKRDSMGRYSRDMMHHEGNMSYARDGRMGGRGGRGGYSRDDAKDYMMEQLEEMMEQAEKPQEKEALRRCMQAIERA